MTGNLCIVDLGYICLSLYKKRGEMTIGLYLLMAWHESTFWSGAFNVFINAQVGRIMYTYGSVLYWLLNGVSSYKHYKQQQSSLFLRLFQQRSTSRSFFLCVGAVKKRAAAALGIQRWQQVAIKDRPQRALWYNVMTSYIYTVAS